MVDFKNGKMEESYRIQMKVQCSALKCIGEPIGGYSTFQNAIVLFVWNQLFKILYVLHCLTDHDKLIDLL